MTAPLILLPNVPAITTAFLRAQPEVVDIFDDRVVTALPKNPTWPLLKVEQFTDRPITVRPLWLVAASLQISSFGGPKALAHAGAETCRAALVARFSGAYNYGEGKTGVISTCRCTGLRDEPDQTYTPARPRWLFTAVVYAHPAL